MNRIQSFLLNTLKHFQRLYWNLCPTFGEFKDEYLFYNTNITIENHTIYFRNFLRNNVFEKLYICWMIDSNFITYKEFPQMYCLPFEGIVKAVK